MSDGFGIGYFIQPDDMVFNITAWNAGSPMKAVDLTAALNASLRDMDSLCSSLN